jgi:hypothetical protein
METEKISGFPGIGAREGGIGRLPKIQGQSRQKKKKKSSETVSKTK